MSVMKKGLELFLTSHFEGFSLEIELASSSPNLVLFGPSGAGKTLTLRYLAGITRPNQGRICLDGQVLFDSKAGLEVPAQERNIGFLPQNPALFPHLTVRENMHFGVRRRLTQELREEIQALACTLGIVNLLDRSPQEISGGQAQRVALVRALAPGPRLLLLDEPFSALDGPLRLRLREELLKIQEATGVSLVVVTHDLDEARMLAQDLAVLRRGKILQLGPVEEVLDHPSDVCVARLTGVRNLFSGVVEGTPKGGQQLRAGALVVPCSCSKRQVGAPITLALRAERLRLVAPETAPSRGPGKSPTYAPVRLLSRVIRSQNSLVRVVPTGGEHPDVEVLVPSWSWRNQSLEVGSEALLEIHPAAIHVLEGEDPRTGEDPCSDGEAPPTCDEEHET
jgi:molybdate transport system ATP-binding protein